MLATLLSCLLAAAAPSPELSFDLWDWTPPCRDLALFEIWVRDLTGMGFNRIEISAPWRELEPEPSRFKMDWLEERLRVCETAGVGVRVRINSYYANAVPAWFEGDRWLDADGKTVPQAPPSIMDERFWEHYGPLCARIAETCVGRDVLFSPFIGIHAELKYGDWWSCDESTMSAWRTAIAEPRPPWLLEAAGETPLPDRPPLPPDTEGRPDASPTSRAFIAFREHCWRQAVERVAESLRQGDPEARLSAPLGESYRRQSAHMSNLDYWGLSRGAVQIVHSYDFFWHAHAPAWMAEASVAAFQGIGGCAVAFEFDGTESMFGLGYSTPHLLALGQSAARAGAGLKLANNSYSETLPSQQPLIAELVALWQREWRQERKLPESETVLVFFSKWANYSYREPTEWLHDAQFGVYRLFLDAGIPVRIICEDNLHEALNGYRALYLAFSPTSLMTAPQRAALDALTLPVLADYLDVPEPAVDSETVMAHGLADITLTIPACPTTPMDLSHLGEDYDYALRTDDGRKLLAHKPGRAVMGYPLGALYLHGNQPNAHLGMAIWALQRIEELRPQTSAPDVH